MTQYEQFWAIKYLADGCETIEEIVDIIRDQAATLDEMSKAGVQLQDTVDGGHFVLTTEDAKVAERFDMQESEFEEEEEEELVDEEDE